MKMKELIQKIITRNSIHFKQGLARVENKRNQWNSLAKRSIKIMQEVETQAEECQLLSNLHAFETNKIENLKNKLPMIQLSFGQRLVGYHKDTKNVFATESGCSLTISQSVTGGVICILYPFSSALYHRKEKYIIVKIVSSPDELLDSDIYKLIDNLFSYAQVSSIFGTPQLNDKLCISFLKAKHWWLYFKFTEVALNLLDKATGVEVKNVLSE